KPANHLYLTISIKKLNDDSYQFTLECNRMPLVFHYPNDAIFNSISRTIPSCITTEEAINNGAAKKIKEKYEPVTISKNELNAFYAFAKSREIFVEASIDKCFSAGFSGILENGVSSLKVSKRTKNKMKGY